MNNNLYTFHKSNHYCKIISKQNVSDIDGLVHSFNIFCNYIFMKKNNNSHTNNSHTNNSHTNNQYSDWMQTIKNLVDVNRDNLPLINNINNNNRIMTFIVNQYNKNNMSDNIRQENIAYYENLTSVAFGMNVNKNLLNNDDFLNVYDMRYIALSLSNVLNPYDTQKKYPLIITVTKLKYFIDYCTIENKVGYYDGNYGAIIIGTLFCSLFQSPTIHNDYHSVCVKLCNNTFHVFDSMLENCVVLDDYVIMQYIHKNGYINDKLESFKNDVMNLDVIVKLNVDYNDYPLKDIIIKN